MQVKGRLLPNASSPLLAGGDIAASRCPWRWRPPRGLGFQPGLGNAAAREAAPVAGRGIWTLHFGSHDALIPAQQQAILAKGTGLIPERINCDKMCVLPFGQTGSN
uniref:Uncharacterized protein n=1 Tax=Oryza meridionalis TaxID=40149 RepID=A0A0E0CU19_9ORYZ